MKHPHKPQRRKPKRTGRAVPITPEMAVVIKEQLDAFREKFGREPGPGDPIFFDPNADTPKDFDENALRLEAVDAMKRAGIAPRLIYAFIKTGMIITSDNYQFVSASDLAEWDAALEEYDRRQREGEFN